MTVFRIPAAVSDEPTHWLVSGSTGQPSFIACGIPANTRYSHTSDNVTCTDCASVVLRTKCLEPDPADVLGLGIVCKQKLGADGTHEGPHDWQKPLGSPLDDVVRVQVLTDGVTRDSGAFASEARRSAEVRRAAEALRASQWSDDGGFTDTPSDVLPRRVPGEALREAEGERQVIERWTA